jgi:hypothetical protein
MNWFWNESGHWYTFWSGFGASLSEFAIIGFVWTHFTCHAKRCFRPARHVVEGTAFKTCRRHHPDLPDHAPTVEEIHAAAAAAKSN